MEHKLTAVLLMVVYVIIATAEAEDDTPKRPKHHVKHGKQDYMTPDGKHNVHFDHEGILGTVGDEGAFDKMEPEEAKYRLGLIAKRMDRNMDGYVSRDELTDWIVMSYRILDEQEALEDFRHTDDDTDEKVSWNEYLKHEFNMNAKQVKQMKEKNDEKYRRVIAKIESAKKRFKAADVDKDRHLDQKEFFAFSHPQNYVHMHKHAVNLKIAEYDQDGDNKITMEEFHAAAVAEDDKEMIESEVEIFGYLDRNKDGVVNAKEIRQWVIQEPRNSAWDEADDLINQADTNNDEQLSEKEIVDKHEIFVGGLVTNEGKQLHFIRHADEDL